MGSFDNWAHRQIRQSQRRAKWRTKASATLSAAQARATAQNASQEALKAKERWVYSSPDNAKYDKDGNPVDITYWADHDS